MTWRSAVLALCLMFLPVLVFAQGSEVKKEATPMEDNVGDIAEGIHSTFNSYLKAFQEKNIDGVMAVFSDVPNTVMMGTGPDEIWLGKEDIRRAHQAFFADFIKESFKQTLVSMGVNDNAAWLTGYIVVTQQNQKSTNTFQINLSLVLERVEGKWYLVTMHFSNLTGPK